MTELVQVRIRFCWKVLFTAIALLSWCCGDLKGADEPGEQGQGIRIMDAVRKAVALNPSVRLQKKDVMLKKGLLYQQSGAFDTALKTSASYDRQYVPLTPVQLADVDADDPFKESQSAAASIEKVFRSGISMGPSVSVTQSTEDDYATKDNLSVVGFSVNVPILKGGGDGAPGSYESAAELQYKGSLENLSFTISSRALEAAEAYWFYLAAARRVQIRSESEERAQKLLEETKALVKADELPAVEIDQASARLADESLSLKEAHQDLLEARHALGLVMGVAFDEVEVIQPPVDEFVDADAGIKFTDTQKDLLVQHALQTRSDLSALRRQEQAAEILLQASSRNVLPQLDLQLQAGYSGITTGSDQDRFWDSLSENRTDMSYGFSVAFEWPFRNSRAKGILLQQKATFDQAAIARSELERQIKSSVTINFNQVRTAVEEVLLAQKVSDVYKRALQNERKKLQMGQSTLVDVVFAERNLTGALLNQLSFEQGYSSAIARLRHLAGLLVEGTPESPEIREGSLKSWPHFMDGLHAGRAANSKLENKHKIQAMSGDEE